MKKNDESDSKTINRRNFLYKLGLGTTLAIAGYYIIDPLSNIEGNKNTHTSDKPLLKKEVNTFHEDNDLFLTYNNSKYCVNKTGAEVINFLDGNHTVPDISTKISSLLNIAHSEMLDSSVAKFITQLGSAGFLVMPFYVTLYENYE